MQHTVARGTRDPGRAVLAGLGSSGVIREGIQRLIGAAGHRVWLWWQPGRAGRLRLDWRDMSQRLIGAAAGPMNGVAR